MRKGTLRARRIGDDDANGGEPAISEGEPLDELDIVGHASVAKPSALPTEENDGIPFGEDVPDLRLLIEHDREIVHHRRPQFFESMGAGDERELRRREDLEG